MNCSRFLTGGLAVGPPERWSNPAHENEATHPDFYRLTENPSLKYHHAQPRPVQKRRLFVREFLSGTSLQIQRGQMASKQKTPDQESVYDLPGQNNVRPNCSRYCRQRIDIDRLLW